ncbi:MAG: hypothetical protein GY786_04230 [Proteobacteria bacterium]|nr:hypothetical protein [Pseudomonadota bacterium]
MQTNTDHILAQAQNSLRNKTSKSSQEDGELGKNEFLNLFLTQMSHQNPTDPMDSGAMMTQMAQLGSMEQLQNLNQEMKILNTKQSEAAKIQALNFLNKDVFVDQKSLELSHGTSAPVHFSLDREASDFKIIVEEQDGAPVLTRQLGTMDQGRHKYTWDGKNLEGTLMADGKYNIKLISVFADGTSKSVQPYHSGRVSNLEFKKGVPWVSLQGKNIQLSEIKSVDTASQRIFGTAKPLPILQSLETKRMMDHP